MIRINAFLATNDRNRAEIKLIADQLIEASQKEEGCLGYDFFESITRPNIFVIVETWRDAAALEAHEATDHFRRLVPLMKTLADVKTERMDR